MPTRQTTDPMAFKFFSHTITLSEVYQVEGFSNQFKGEQLFQ